MQTTMPIERSSAGDIAAGGRELEDIISGLRIGRHPVVSQKSWS
jgi:hypothetical protein